MSDGIKPAFAIGTLVEHPHFGAGRIVNIENNEDYVIVFKSGPTKVAVSFTGMRAAEGADDPGMARIRQAVREALCDFGWLEDGIELAKRWEGGTLRMIPGKTGLQNKDVPVEVFFKKLIGIRDKMRVLEQKINSNTALSPTDKLEMQGYITRCYGSLTTFNVLFAHEESQFTGVSEGT